MSKTKTILKRFARMCNYKLLSDVTVGSGESAHTFEHILIGSFGAFCVRSFKEKGELYGNENDSNFVLVDYKMSRNKTENIVKKSLKDNMTLRKIVADAKIYNVKIENAVVIEHKKCKAMITAPSCEVMAVSELSKYLNDKFDRDNKVDAEAVASAVENAK
ncbi:MAG: NERD domain-containing protein [Ruminococcaceae bacterium]|nr:NERD domain-containing protein [Oscillospiraceae bacterium]